jgi:hypothetical protein
LHQSSLTCDLIYLFLQLHTSRYFSIFLGIQNGYYLRNGRWQQLRLVIRHYTDILLTWQGLDSLVPARPRSPMRSRHGGTHLSYERFHVHVLERGQSNNVSSIHVRVSKTFSCLFTTFLVVEQLSISIFLQDVNNVCVCVCLSVEFHTTAQALKISASMSWRGLTVRIILKHICGQFTTLSTNRIGSFLMLLYQSHVNTRFICSEKTNNTLLWQLQNNFLRVISTQCLKWPHKKNIVSLTVRPWVSCRKTSDIH